jgi:hypothetical protein
MVRLRDLGEVVEHIHDGSEIEIAGPRCLRSPGSRVAHGDSASRALPGRQSSPYCSFPWFYDTGQLANRWLSSFTLPSLPGR